MFLKTSSLCGISLLVASAVALPSSSQRVARCSNEPLTEEQKASLINSTASISSAAIGEPFTVPTWLHVLSQSDTVGNVPDTQLNDQIRVLNEDFAPHGISFRLEAITRTVNPSWSNNEDGLNMRRQLRQGGYDGLNIYFMGNPGALGYCSVPYQVEPGSDNFFGDGCAVSSATVPGGSPPYNLGRTATHEVGHWLGLGHTFDGGCSDPGDSVEDTPSEDAAAFGCPTGRDSCPDRPGLDPITNYMDYTDDSCMDQFTTGQKDRMHNAWYNIRVPQGL